MTLIQMTYLAPKIEHDRVQGATPELHLASRVVQKVNWCFLRDRSLFILLALLAARSIINHAVLLGVLSGLDIGGHVFGGYCF